MICGERIARKKRSKKQEAKYPKYRVLADHTLLGQVMIDGRRETIKAADEREYKAKIDALRTGVLELKAHPEKRLLKSVLREYVDKNDNVLSPATIRGYESSYRSRFKNYMGREIGKIDFQEMINAEAKDCAPKTVANGWGLVTAAFNDAKIPVPEVNLPMVPESDGDFLDYEEIEKFLKAIHGDVCEAAALLMLHGLRTSEVLKLDAENDITDTQILVRGSVVPNKNHKLVEKKTNKNRRSTRSVPIMIPRLTEVLPKSGKAVTWSTPTLRVHIEAACRKAGVTVCSPHDLRRSFASLGYHLKWSERAIMAIGGWSNPDTVHKIYVKLSQKDIADDVDNMRNYYKFTTASQEAP